MNKEKLYVADCEFNGAFVGTLSQIEEWMGENNVSLWNIEFYELGNKVKVSLGVV